MANKEQQQLIDETNEIVENFKNISRKTLDRAENTKKVVPEYLDDFMLSYYVKILNTSRFIKSDIPYLQ